MATKLVELATIECPIGLAWPSLDMCDRINHNEYIYEVYDMMEHPAWFISPHEAYTQRMELAGARSHRIIVYREKHMEERDVPDLQLVRLDHAPALLAFERENRAYFAASVPDRGDEFFTEFDTRHAQLFEWQAARTDYFHLLVAERGEVVGRVNLTKVADGLAEPIPVVILVKAQNSVLQ